jgi:hypothetical protein
MIFIYEAEMEEVIAVLTSISKRILIVSDNLSNHCCPESTFYLQHELYPAFFFIILTTGVPNSRYTVKNYENTE